MQITTNNTAAASAAPSAAGGKAGGGSIESTFAAMLDASNDPKEMLHTITKDGMASMWAWQLEQIKKKAAEKVMQGMGVTRESIEALPEDERIDIMKRIMEEVERMVQQAMEEEMRKQNPQIALGLQVMDSDTMQGVIDATATRQAGA